MKIARCLVRAARPLSDGIWGARDAKDAWEISLFLAVLASLWLFFSFDTGHLIGGQVGSTVVLFRRRCLDPPRTMATPDEELDCLICGACCREGSDGRILIPEADLVRWRRLGRDDIAEAIVPGHFGEVAFAHRADGACVHLGTQESVNACSIYEIRGTTCREFERGSRQCREFRRDAGIDPRS